MKIRNLQMKIKDHLPHLDDPGHLSLRRLRAPHVDVGERLTQLGKIKDQLSQHSELQSIFDETTFPKRPHQTLFVLTSFSDTTPTSLPRSVTYAWLSASSENMLCTCEGDDYQFSLCLLIFDRATFPDLLHHANLCSCQFSTGDVSQFATPLQ